MPATYRHTTSSPAEGPVAPGNVSEETDLAPIIMAAEGCGVLVDVQPTIAGRAVRVCVDGVRWYVTNSAEPAGWVAMPEIDVHRHPGPDLMIRYDMAREPHEQTVPIHRWGEFLAGF